MKNPRSALVAPLVSLLLGVAMVTTVSAAQASPGMPERAFLVAKRSAEEGSAFDRFFERREADKRKSSSRDNKDSKGYGYGYERRQRNSDGRDSSLSERGPDREERSSRSERNDRSEKSERPQRSDDRRGSNRQ